MGLATVLLNLWFLYRALPLLQQPALVVADASDLLQQQMSGILWFNLKVKNSKIVTATLDQIFHSPMSLVVYHKHAFI